MLKNFGNCLLVDDLEKSLEFYQGKMGLEINSQDGKFVSFKGISLAVHYVWEDVWWKRRNKNLPWLEKLIRI